MTQPSSPSWTEPGAYPVADGVHRIPLPLPLDGLRAVNVYAVESEDGLVLVDGGWAIEESRRRLEAALASIGHRLADITRFLVTHVHRDHYTQAVAVRREVGSHVSLGIGDKPTLDLVASPATTQDPTVARLHRAGAVGLARQWARAMGQPGPSRADYEPPDTWLHGEQVLEVGSRVLHAVPTPGHTQGHYVFADLDAGLLFAGDHVLPSITPSIGFEPAFADQPLRDFLGSLARVRAMPDLTLLPAHGQVRPGSHRRVDELLAHHEDRLDLCARAVGSGRRTAHEVAGELGWTRRARRLDELDVFNAALATLETMTHTELLAARGRVGRCECDGVLHYTPPPG